MIRKISQVGEAKVEYFVQGTNPKLLIHSGIHGDEHEVIDSIKEFLTENATTLPDFVYVPMVSPSAVIAKTRTNSRGLDLNRHFFHGATEAEVLANKKIAKQYQFDLLVSFHEDTEFSQFYMYDSGIFESHPQWTATKAAVRELGVSLLNGIDDPKDPILGYEFVDGYNACANNECILDGSFEYWAQSKQIVKHWIMPEIPTAIKRSVKTKIVATIFENLIKTYFEPSVTISA